MTNQAAAAAAVAVDALLEGRIDMAIALDGAARSGELAIIDDGWRLRLWFGRRFGRHGVCVIVSDLAGNTAAIERFRALTTNIRAWATLEALAVQLGLRWHDAGFGALPESIGFY
jgi:hypothetical protein